MIPKKLKRKIVVDKIEYEYCVTGCTDIFIKNLTTGKIIKRYYNINLLKENHLKTHKPTQINFIKYL
jgi:hypothetical protein